MPPRPRPFYGGYRRSRPVIFYGGGGGGYTGGAIGGGGGIGCGGCLTTLLVLLVVAALLAVLGYSCSGPSSSSYSGSQNSSVQQVTHTHEKLPDSACDESPNWLDDRANWIDSENTVIKALKYFYKKTGSQPYLVVATDVDGKTDFTDEEGEEWASAIYDEQFDDGGHTVVAFVEYSESEYAYYIIAGREAQSVIDQEAREIIADEINYWYTDGSLDDSEYFAKVFEESADTIMFDYEETTKTSNNRRRTVTIALCATAAAAVIGLIVVRTSKRKKEEYEEARKLAETPLGTSRPPVPTVTYTSDSSSAATTSSSSDAGETDYSSTLSELEQFEQKYGSDDSD